MAEVRRPFCMNGKGTWTGQDLSDLTSLCAPWTITGGQLRPPFSQAAARLSLELAASAYDLQLDCWREAGWRDVSYLVDNTLLTGEEANGGDGRRLAGAFSEYLQYMARARLKRKNPISQLRGALRQRESSDTCKAVVMLHPRSRPGQYLVAVGFMGTGKRIYDWFSNFRLIQQSGAHQGFLQLTQEFSENCARIQFPETARELGLESLTLRDILSECRRPGSRFRIWMAGHSQGGAVMQLFAFQEIRSGLLRQNMLGYGFASPCVLYDEKCCDLHNFPLYHIVNGDDVPPRVGALLHIGRCMMFRTDDSLRERCYAEAWQQPLFREALRLLQGVRDTNHAVLFTLALLRAMKARPTGDTIGVLAGMTGKILPERLTDALSGQVDGGLQALIGKLEQIYFQLTARPVAAEGLIGLWQARMEGLIAQWGLRPFFRALLLSLSLPHKLRAPRERGLIASYQYITLERFDELRPQLLNRYAAFSLAAPVKPPQGRAPRGRFGLIAFSRTRRTRDRNIREDKNQ